MVVVSVEKLLVSWCLAARCFAIRLLKRKIVDNIKNKDMYVYKYIYIYIFIIPFTFALYAI